MSSATELARELERVSAVLQAAGRDQLANTVNRAVEALRQLEHAAVTERDFLTTTEAAKLLGVRSINTIKQWASQGRLEGYRLGSRVLVARWSVEQLLRDGALSPLHDYEREAEDALALIGGGAGEPDDLIGCVFADDHGSDEVGLFMEQVGTPLTVPTPAAGTTTQTDPPTLPGVEHPLALAYRRAHSMRRKGRVRAAKRTSSA
jgi:excisionase family DNA binding protein